MEIETVKISELKPHPKNPRIHPDLALERLTKSIKEYGWTNPILVSEDGYVLAGHARLKAAEKAGLTEVPVIRLPLSGARAEAYMIADNKLQDMTEWDFPKLKDILEELNCGQFPDIEITGFDMKEIENLMTQFHVPEEGLIPDDEIPEKSFVCDNCGEIFGLYESIYEFRKERNNHFFCSKQCYLEFHKQDSFETMCAKCGKALVIPNYRRKEGRHYYCSYECRKTSREIKCDWCGMSFERKPSLMRGDHNFCSRGCMGIWQSENMTGENSNSWLGGWEKYYGANWTEQKDKARERDNYICQKCGIMENGKAHDVHHKKAFREFGLENYKQANELENLVTLCPSCHNTIEPKRQKFTGKKAPKL